MRSSIANSNLFSTATRRRARRWAPPAWGALALIGFIFLWRASYPPTPLPGPLISCAPDERVNMYLRDRPFMSRLSLRFSDIIVAGDSRVMEGIAPPTFRKSLGLREVNLCGSLPFGSLLVRQLPTLDPFPPKKLVISLTPGDLAFTVTHLETDPNPPWVRCRALLDDCLNMAVQRIDSRLVTMVTPEYGMKFTTDLTYDCFTPLSQWWAVHPVTRTDVAYNQFFESNLSQDMEQRQQNLTILARMVAALRAKGWQIVCIRMPISSNLLRVEDRFFPSANFDLWCNDNHLLYFDYSKSSSFQTYDGSHMGADQAMAFTATLAADLRSKAGW